ncbi:MAG: hypothetical protein SCK28_01630 [Bacillota bacterium]|nr:hypothetical protein [Bacillota bacterium]
MTDKNKEMMKKLVEAKKQKSAAQKSNLRGQETLGSRREGVKNFRKGGLFDK